MAKSARALAVFSDHDSQEAIFQILTACRIEPIFCSTMREARMILRSEAVDIVFCETSFADGSFEDLLCALGSGEPIPPVIVCSRFYDPALYLDLMERGASDFIVCPCRNEEVQWILDTAFRRSPKPVAKLKASAGHAA